MNPRPTRARLQSLCGTARGMASKDAESKRRLAPRTPCRYAAIWACQSSMECSQRLSTHRRRHARGCKT
jgi:hypothetical protein